MELNLVDWLRLLHPILAVTVVFPLLGIVVSRAVLTRSRRLASSDDRKKIPTNVGPEHVQTGHWFAIAVVGLYLLGCARPMVAFWLKQQAWSQTPLQLLLVLLTYGITLGALWGIFKAANQRVWRLTFAGLTAIGLLVLGWQEGIFRRDNEWFISHFYFGLVATLLMVFSLAILPDIYRDRSQTWRKIHLIANTVAVLLFIAQGITGTRDLLEIPLSWQESTVYACDYDKASPTYKTCPPVTKSPN